MRCNRYCVFCFAFIIFLYAGAVLAWAIGQEIYRVVFAVAGVFSASWLLHAVADQLHEED